MMKNFIVPLGNLFYAISASDKHITKEEFSVFKNLIQEEFKDILNQDDKEKLVEIYIESAKNKFDVYDSFNKFSESNIQLSMIFEIIFF